MIAKQTSIEAQDPIFWTKGAQKKQATSPSTELAPCPTCGKQAIVDRHTAVRPDGTYEIVQWRCGNVPNGRHISKPKAGSHPICREERKLEAPAAPPTPPPALQVDLASLVAQLAAVVSTLAAGQQAITNKLQQMQSPQPALNPVADLSFFELMTRNLDDVHKTTKPAGHHAIECHTRMWIALWGHRPAMAIKRAEVEQWALARAQSHSHSTVMHELQVIQRAYNLAVYHEWLPRNPIAGPRLNLKMNRRHQVLSEEDEAKLAAAYAAARRPGKPNLWEIEEFAILTGVRLGEQVRLEVGHVQGKLLQIPEDGKTGTRMVPLCKRAREIADSWCAISSKWMFWSWSKSDDRLAVGDTHVHHHWRPAIKRAGLTGYQRRDLRRTFASRLIAKGVPIFEVQKLLGHTDTKTTQIYARVGMDQLSDAVSVFDNE